MKSTRSTVLALLTAGLLVVAGSAIASDKPDLSGRWKLNRDLSDNPREKMQESRGSGARGSFGGRGMRDPGVGGGGGTRGGMGGGGMRGGGPPGGMGSGGMRGDRGGSGGPGVPGGDPFGMSAEEITIAQSDTSIVIKGNERERVLRTDGKVDEVDTPRGGRMAISSRWDEAGFVVTMKDEMHKTVETWTIDPESHRLVVTTEVDRGEGRPKMTIKRVWERIED